MLERGQYLARRGMINLSLPMTDVELNGFAKAFTEFLHIYERLSHTIAQRVETGHP
jgi:hypothetical protein